MKKDELLNQLNRYQELVQEFDCELEKLSESLPNIAESPVFRAVEELIEKAVGDWVEQFEEPLLEWRHWYKFGEKPMQIINEDNTKIELSSNEQFADFFGE